MAAPKGEEQLNKLFNEIIIDISENGKSALSSLTGKMSSATFYKLLEDEEKLNKYEKAMQMRTDRMAEEILEISDRDNSDGATVQRDRLRVDARKWVLAKMNPRKYGDKVDLTSDNKAFAANVSITVTSKENADKLNEFLDGKSE